MAKRTTKAAECRGERHGHGVWSVNGQRFTEAVYEEGDTLRKAQEALGDFEAAPRVRKGAYEVRRFHLVWNERFTCHDLVPA